VELSIDRPVQLYYQLSSARRGELMAESVVVGAGLAGLVAAINLARQGRDVVILSVIFS